MTETPYLVALALVEFAGRRALPLTGKSQAAAALEASDPGDTGRSLALELLLRLWQRSDEGPLQRAGGEASLLLLEIPLDVMTEEIPRLKAKWIAGGDTQELLSALASLAIRGWSIAAVKYEPVRFTAWP
ncbi:MAG: hypothetical protein ACK46L_11615 [Synechococcaceae cyanobacterium]|jgi:hypothetical protein